MSRVRFDLKPLLRAPPIKFRLIPVDKIPENKVKPVDFPLDKLDVLSWSRKYDEDHQWWVRARGKEEPLNITGTYLLNWRN